MLIGRKQMFIRLMPYDRLDGVLSSFESIWFNAQPLFNCVSFIGTASTSIKWIKSKAFCLAQCISFKWACLIANNLIYYKRPQMLRVVCFRCCKLAPFFRTHYISKTIDWSKCTFNAHGSSCLTRKVQKITIIVVITEL